MCLGLEFYFEVIIVDIGCGSGILFIGVVLLGVYQIYVVDIDFLVIRLIINNGKLN